MCLEVRKILSEKPLEQPLEKLAKHPKAYDAWRLGYCYAKAMIAYDPMKPKLANLDEAEKRAAALGVKLPTLPDTAELPGKVDFVIDKSGEHVVAGLRNSRKPETEHLVLTLETATH